MGLSIPKLPSVSVSRSRLSRRDLSAAPSVEQETEVSNEQAAYAKGPLRLQYRRDAGRVADRLFPASGLKTEQSAAEAELNFTELKGRVQRASLRASHQGQSSEAGGIAARQDFDAASLYLATRQAKHGRWATYGLWELLEVRGRCGQALAKQRSWSPPRLCAADEWRPARLRALRTYRARQQSVSESAGAEWRRSPKGVQASANGSGLGGGGRSLLSDALRQRQP